MRADLVEQCQLVLENSQNEVQACFARLGRCKVLQSQIPNSNG